MTEAASRITFYFDFLCPFAYRASLWIDEVQQRLGAQLQVEWRYFSLEQINNQAGDGWKIWEQAEDYVPQHGRNESRSLLAFWAAEAARRQGAAAFDSFRRALFRARHEEKLALGSRDDLLPVAERVGLDLAQFAADFQQRALLEALRNDHETACAKYRTFGVPTIAFDDENACYLKIGQVPPVEDALPLFEELRHSLTSRRWLSEIKRPNP